MKNLPFILTLKLLVIHILRPDYIFRFFPRRRSSYLLVVNHVYRASIMHTCCGYACSQYPFSFFTMMTSERMINRVSLHNQTQQPNGSSHTSFFTCWVVVFFSTKQYAMFVLRLLMFVFVNTYTHTHNDNNNKILCHSFC